MNVCTVARIHVLQSVPFGTYVFLRWPKRFRKILADEISLGWIFYINTYACSLYALLSFFIALADCCWLLVPIEGGHHDVVGFDNGPLQVLAVHYHTNGRNSSHDRGGLCVTFFIIPTNPNRRRNIYE